MSNEFAQKEIAEIPQGTQPIAQDEAQTHLKQVPHWELIDAGKKIRREVACENFVSALEFVNAIGDIAEEAQHHPDIHIYYNTVVVELWTHTIAGLSKNDFVVAARINTLL